MSRRAGADSADYNLRDMARRPSLTLEVAAYVLILVVAAWLRFGQLGSLPLNDFEARAALPAFELAQTGTTTLGAQPGYSLLTALTFSLSGSNEWLARLWPAVLGLALVALPYAWRNRLGRRTALVLALGLALDPGLVALSRLASGAMLALAGLLLAASAWAAGRHRLAGAFVGLGLLAAPAAYIGVLVALLVWAFFIRSALPKDALGPAALSLLAVMLLGSSLFFQFPGGFASVAAPLTEFVTGWLHPSGVAAGRVLFALVGYSAPTLLLGMWGALLAWRQGRRELQAASLLAAAALALILLYPGRQVADLIWVLVPLWLLAASVIASSLQLPASEPQAAWGHFALMVVLLSFWVLSLARIPQLATLPEAVRPALFIAAGGVVLAAVVTLLVALGWSARAARDGLVWSLAVFCMLFALAGATRFGNPAAGQGAELWSPGAAAGQLGLLRDSLDALSLRATGQRQALSLELGSPSPALAWLGRQFAPPAQREEADLLLLPADVQEPARQRAYRGQSFTLSSSPAWQMLPTDVIAWWLYRQTPQQQETIILWAAADVLPHDVLTTSSGDFR